MNPTQLAAFIGATVYVFNGRGGDYPAYLAAVTLLEIDGDRARVLYRKGARASFRRWIDADRIETDEQAGELRCLRSNAAPVRVTPNFRRNPKALARARREQAEYARLLREREG